MLKLNFVCVDRWDRPVYRDQNGRIYKDVSCGLSEPNLYKSAYNTIDGEPYSPLNRKYEFLTKYEINPDRFKQSMLVKLQEECLYYLAKEKENEKRLCTSNKGKQIDTMKKLWNELPENEKPEWLTMEDIENLEKEMNA